MMLKLVLGSILGLGLLLPGALTQKTAGHSAGKTVAAAACCCSGSSGCACGCDLQDCSCATCPICSTGECCGFSLSTVRVARAMAMSGSGPSKCQDGKACCLAARK